MSLSKKIKNPYDLFSQEIWEMIIDNASCRGVVSMLTGIPKVAVHVKNRQRFWLIAKILPFIRIHLDREDILNLRLVCKQWKRRVDHYFQNQAYYRAYSEEEFESSSQFWAYLQTHEPAAIKSKVGMIDTNFISENQTMISNLQSLPALHNPFPFRDIRLNLTQEPGTANEHIGVMEEILQKFGNQVWCMEIEVPSAMTFPEITAFTRMLTLCPQLKSIRLEFKEDDVLRLDEVSAENVMYFRDNLPQLPQLESLKVNKYDKLGEDLVNAIFHKYCPQLKRLTIMEWVGGEEWNRLALSNILPSLCELRIGIYSDDQEMPLYDDLYNLLGQLNSPKLKMLQLKYMNEEDTLTMSVEDVIFPWLRRFKQLQYLEITPLSCCENEELLLLMELRTLDPVLDNFPSIEILKIPDGRLLDYYFLKCFPSLTLLEVYTFLNPKELEDAFLDYCPPLRELFIQLDGYNSEIWSLLPKLKLLIIQAHYGPQGKVVHKFHLADYLKIRQLEGNSTK